VGECYPFAADDHFLLTADNHNSVNGIREYCMNKGGSYSYCSMDCEEFSIPSEALSEQLGRYPDKKNRLFAFPAQSNVTGVQHSLEWVQKAYEHGWDVLLDAFPSAFQRYPRISKSLWASPKSCSTARFLVIRILLLHKYRIINLF